MPDLPHLPHGDDGPTEGSTSAPIGALGNFTNVSAKAVTGEMVTWELLTSESKYHHDTDFAKAFKRTGAVVAVDIPFASDSQYFSPNELGPLSDAGIKPDHLGGDRHHNLDAAFVVNFLMSFGSFQAAALRKEKAFEDVD